MLWPALACDRLDYLGFLAKISGAGSPVDPSLLHHSSALEVAASPVVFVSRHLLNSFAFCVLARAAQGLLCLKCLVALLWTI